MKYLVLALTLLCGSAHATNVFYAIIQDQVSGSTNYVYLTNEHSKECQGRLRVAKLETLDGKPLDSNVACWIWSGGTNVVLKTGVVVPVNGLIVKGAQKEAGILMGEIQQQVKDMAASQMREVMAHEAHP